MSSSPVYAERQAAVAGVASRIFGVNITPAQVIGETLERITIGDVHEGELCAAVALPAAPEFGPFVQDPLVIWLENKVGLR